MIILIQKNQSINNNNIIILKMNLIKLKKFRNGIRRKKLRKFILKKLVHLNIYKIKIKNNKNFKI